MKKSILAALASFFLFSSGCTDVESEVRKLKGSLSKSSLQSIATKKQTTGDFSIFCGSATGGFETGDVDEDDGGFSLELGEDKIYSCYLLEGDDFVASLGDKDAGGNLNIPIISTYSDGNIEAGEDLSFTSDFIETTAFDDSDTDGDGTKDSKDLDVDEDGVADASDLDLDIGGFEISFFFAWADTDGDGSYDCLSTDADEFGDTDGDGVDDFADFDDDGDDIEDNDEADFTCEDSDEDGYCDEDDLNDDNDDTEDGSDADKDGDGVSACASDTVECDSNFECQLFADDDLTDDFETDNVQCKAGCCALK